MNFLLENLTVEDILLQPGTPEYNMLMPTILNDFHDFVSGKPCEIDYDFSIQNCSKPTSFFYTLDEYIDIVESSFIDAFCNSCASRKELETKIDSELNQQGIEQLYEDMVLSNIIYSNEGDLFDLLCEDRLNYINYLQEHKRNGYPEFKRKELYYLPETKLVVSIDLLEELRDLIGKYGESHHFLPSSGEVKKFILNYWDEHFAGYVAQEEGY